MAGNKIAVEGTYQILANRKKNVRNGKIQLHSKFGD